MNIKKIFPLLLTTVLATSLQAENNATDAGPIVIEMIPSTRSATNAPTFYVSRHAITPEQYCAFLNAVDTTEGRLYHTEWGDMTRKEWDLLTISKSVTPPFHYTPINYDTYRTKAVVGTNGLWVTVTNNIAKRTIMKGIPMADAARFCNWLANGQPIGPIGDNTTETGSYTFFENRVRQPNDSFSTKTIYDPKFPVGTRVKNAYMHVDRSLGASWRLPTRVELSQIFSSQSWGSLDSDPSFWYWTEDAYIKDFPASMWDPYHTGFIQNTGGYYRVKNGQPGGIADLQTHKFQEESVVDTGFCVVFSANNLPKNGFQILLPTDVAPVALPTNSPVPPQVLPPVLPPVQIPPHQ